MKTRFAQQSIFATPSGLS